MPSKFRNCLFDSKRQVARTLTLNLIELELELELGNHTSVALCWKGAATLEDGLRLGPK